MNLAVLTRFPRNSREHCIAPSTKILETGALWIVLLVVGVLLSMTRWKATTADSDSFLLRIL